MNGAELLVRTAAEAGVKVCFSNPGTTEMPLVSALDTVPGMRAVLGLFEGVCTGAADGYGRMLDRPAMTLLHLGPGLGNGIANLHNARRAGTPILNVVGEHATWHKPFDPPLAMDIEALSGSVSGWHRTVRSANSLSHDTAEAIAAAFKGQIATLIVPQDCQWTECDEGSIEAPKFAYDPVDERAVHAAMGLLSGGTKGALVLGGRAVRRRGLMAAARIKATTGCDLLCESFPAHIERGAGLPDVNRIPYLPEMAIGLLKNYDVFVLVGAREPIAFFGYQGLTTRLLNDGQKLLHIGLGNQDIQEVLETLADSLNTPGEPGPELLAASTRPEILGGSLGAYAICSVLAALQPEGAIVVEEGITNSVMYYGLTAGCPPFSLLTLTGGAIGQGPACSVGAAVACPARPVINLQADGSAMYTVQSLWTQAKEHLNVTTLICSNRSYDILKMELGRSGNTSPGRNAQALTDLGTIDWVKMGEAHGVPSVSVRTCEGLATELKKALSDDGPNLIELRL